MEFVDGVPIDAYAKSAQLGRDARLKLIVKLCSAVAHAHGRLVLHRDIKHDNVLINADGEPRLIDFGVASLLDDPGKGAAPGPLTIGYAAPEQLLGQPVSAATDVFAVGMLTHFLETCALPKRNSDAGVTIDKHALANDDLAAILAKATASDPAERYGSVDALGDDLQKFGHGFPVSARPVSSLTRFKKMVARNKLTAAMSAAALAAVVAGVIGVIGVSVFAVRASEEAEAQRIAQKQGQALIELYETYSSGFTRFVAGIDPETGEGTVIFSALSDLEEEADKQALSEPTRAVETYVFLAEVYADIGRGPEAGRVGRKLAEVDTELNFAIANAFNNTALLSEGFADPKEMTQLLDRAFDFFAAAPKVHSYEAAINRCVKARYTGTDSDGVACLDTANTYLAENVAADGILAASNLIIQAYAADEAIQLERFDDAEAIARDALAFVTQTYLPISVPEAAFWQQLSRMALLQEDWDGARESLNSALASIEDKPQFAFFTSPLERDLAIAENGAGNFKEAQKHAAISIASTEEWYGPEHPRMRDAQAQLAQALAGLGQIDEAIETIGLVINAERASTNDAERLANYDEIKAEMIGD